MKVAPLAALFAILVVGITIEVVEQQDRNAAYALVVLILLGVVTFNAGTFTKQVNGLMGILNTVPLPVKREGGK